MNLGFRLPSTSLTSKRKAIAGFSLRPHSPSVTTTHHRTLDPAAAARTYERRPSSHSPVTPIKIPPLPSTVREQLVSARRSWLDHCLDAPLVDETNNARVHVYGTVHFAPHGGPDGLLELQQLIDRVRPSVLAIEQPFDLAARAGLPYPEVLQHLSSFLPAVTELLAGPDAGSPYQLDDQRVGSDAVAIAATAAAAGVAKAGAAAGDGRREAEVRRLRALLPRLAQPARVGRDLLDPFELYGLYGGCDYVTRPSQLVEAVALFGHLPGLEYAVLMRAAEELGAQVYSVDAPLRLQEKWVAQLVASFSLGEADLSRRLQHDLARAQSLLPAEYLDWDAALAEAVRQLELEQVSEQQGNSGCGEGEGEGVGAQVGDWREPSLRTVTAFKVARAVAAAMVPYEKAQEALGLQAQLQPLKYAVFARKAKHLLLQVRDLCQRMSVRQVRMDAASLKIATPTGRGAGDSKEATGGRGGDVGGRSSSNGTHGEIRAPGERERAAWFDVGSQAEKVVLVVMGRQYVPYIEEMWVNKRSALWHGDVPRTFAASKLEQFGKL